MKHLYLCVSNIQFLFSNVGVFNLHADLICQLETSKAKYMYG